MFNQNICNFMSGNKAPQTMYTLNFVLETKPQKNSGLQMNTVYCLGYVLEGEALLCTEKEKIKLEKGDVFIKFPTLSYALESCDGFQYTYVSFMGSYIYRIMDRLRITKNNFVFKGLHDIEDFWVNALTANSENADINSMSVLMYTFSKIGFMTVKTDADKKTKEENSVSKIMEYIDCNYADAALTVRKIAAELSYHEKYISAMFKKHTGVGLNEYINSVRIRHAFFLVDQGLTSVTDIAHLCGFGNPLYFSKVFKDKTGEPPRSFIEKTVSTKR